MYNCNNPYGYYDNQYGEYYPQNQPFYHNQQRVAQQPPIQQPYNYIPVVFVNGVEGAKAFNVPANKMFYLKDSDSNKLFIKEADQQGKQYIQEYILVKKEEKITQQESITKNDLEGLYGDFTKKIEGLSSQIKSALDEMKKGGVNNE